MSNMQSLKIGGRKWDLDANPDLLYQLLVSITNIEEHIKSLDKRLRNLEIKPNPSPYKITKKV